MKLVGYKKFISQNGNACCYLCVTDNYRQDEINKYGAVGTKVEVINAYDKAVYDMVNPDMINKNIKIDYAVTNNRPYVVGVTIV